MTYDVIVVGTSPISLLKAARERADGKTVLVVDKEDRIGGAWRLFDLFGMTDVEHSPHLFFQDKETYTWLEDYLVCEMVDQPLPPKRCHWESPRKKYETIVDQTLRHSLYRNYMYFVTGHKSFSRRLYLLVKRSLRSLRTTIPIKERQNTSRYPRHGLGKWYKEILANFEKVGIDVLLRATVENVNIGEDNSYIILKDHKEIRAEKIVLNRHLDCKEISIYGEKFVPEYHISYSWHHAYILQKNTCKNGFMECSGIHDIQLYNDGTPFAPDLSEKYPASNLIQFRSTPYEAHSKKPKAEDYINILKDYGLISQDSILLKSNIDIMKRKVMTSPQIPIMHEKASGYLEILIVDDLSTVARENRV